MKKSKFSEEQVVRILGEVDAGKTVRKVCKAHGLSDQTFYAWRRKYAGLQTQDVAKMRDLERENSELKRLLAHVSVLDSRPLVQSSKTSFNVGRTSLSVLSLL